MTIDTSKYFCPICLNSGKGSSWTCGKGHTDYMSSTRTRFPSKTASKTKWKEFVKHLESFWTYEHGTGHFADEFRRHVAMLKKTLNIK